MSSVIDISKIATMLLTTDEEAEKFLVNFIAEARLYGRVDSARGQVLIRTQVPPPSISFFVIVSSLTLF